MNSSLGLPHSRFLPYLAALAALVLAPVSAQDFRPGRPALPAVALDRAVNGEAAVAALAGNLPAVAGHYGLAPASLAGLLRTDRDLWVDPRGRLFFAESRLPDPALAPTGGDGTASAGAIVPLASTFQLHSRASATKKIYLDFDGHTTTGTSWRHYQTGDTTVVTPPYDFDGNPAAFSDAELERIQYIWQRVAEDYAPFDVDVTTEDPGVEGLRKTTTSDGSYGIRVCIGGASQDWYSSSGYGGAAYVGSFDWSTDTPCFVWENNLGNGNEKYVAEAISHEVGHALDLYHDGTSTVGYYQGHGSGADGWAPIMGVGYYKPVVQFSRGEYLDANNREDDLAKITASYNIPYIADDVGDSPANATTVPAGAVALEGLIGTTADVDVFRFETGGGTITLQVSVDSRSPNLNVQATLLDSAAQPVVVASPADSLGVSFSVSGVAAGAYYLKIEGVGAGDPLNTGYSDYGSIGRYILTGTVPAPSPGSLPLAPSLLTAAPTCNDNDPGAAAIALAWADNSANETLFRIQWSVNGSVWSPTQELTTTQPALIHGGLAWKTIYCYRVQAENTFGQSDWSNVTFATTEAAPLIAPALSGSVVSSSQISLVWGAVADATGYALERSLNGVDWTPLASVGAATLAYTDSGLAAATTYSYRICSAGVCAFTTGPSDVVTLTTASNPLVAPVAPANFSARVGSASQIDLTWSDRSSDETGFYVERSSVSEGWTRIGTTAANIRKFSATGLTTGTAYTFRVQAFNRAGVSAYSNTDTATPAASGGKGGGK